MRATFLGRNRFLLLLESSGSAASRTPLQQLTVDEMEKIYSVGTNKKKFLWAMAAAQTSANHGDERALTWY